MKERNINFVYEEETKKTFWISVSFYYNQPEIVVVFLHKKKKKLSLSLCGV